MALKEKSTGGHYIAFVRGEKGGYFECNDAKVRHAELKKYKDGSMFFEAAEGYCGMVYEVVDEVDENKKDDKDDREDDDKKDDDKKDDKGDDKKDSCKCKESDGCKCGECEGKKCTC